MKGFMEETIFIVVEIVLIIIFSVLLARSVGAMFNPDREVAVLNTELLRSKINEACLTKQPVTLEKFSLTQPKPSKVAGITDFLPSFAISGSGATDPHYVLYYESFPPGEAIGWEVYDQFDTRYIAPFDYSKTKDGEGKLIKKTDSITGEDEVAKFFAAMDNYRKDVLNKAQKFMVVETGEGADKKALTTVGYIPAEDGLPTEPKWSTVGSSPIANLPDGSVCIMEPLGKAMCMSNGDIKGTLRISTDKNSVVFRHSEALQSPTSYIEAELQTSRNDYDTMCDSLAGSRIPCSQDAKIFVSLRSNPHRADLLIRGDKIILSAKNKNEYAMNTKDRLHRYRLEIVSGKVNVYVDGQSVPSMTGVDAKTGTENAFLWGVGDIENPKAWNSLPGTAESYWKNVTYAGTSIKLLEEEEVEAYRLAQNPILINNIILNDYRNVIPTETPKPPASDVVKSTSNIGNVGQWNGDRFEFSDYFGITKEERAYIKYEPCGANALCLKTRDAVQRFPLNELCSGAKFIQMEYDARGMDWEDLVPAAEIVAKGYALKYLNKAGEAVAKKVANWETIDILAKSVGYKENALKSWAKAYGRNALKSAAKKGPGVIKALILTDIMFRNAPDLSRNVIEATMAYKNSEFYLASPCQLYDGKMTITYETKCQKKECAKGIEYPIYEYIVGYDGVKTVKNSGSHFMCLESVGKDNTEPEEYKGDVDCIKIKMEQTKRRDFCWTNNPIVPKENIGDRLMGLMPDKTMFIDALIGCGTGALFSSWTGPGAIVGCLAGAGFSVGVDEAEKIMHTFGEKGPKEELLVNAGGLPVTETTSYIEQKDTDGKVVMTTVQMAPAYIGGNALKRFGEVIKETAGLDWAWPG